MSLSSVCIGTCCSSSWNALSPSVSCQLSSSDLWPNAYLPAHLPIKTYKIKPFYFIEGQSCKLFGISSQLLGARQASDGEYSNQICMQGLEAKNWEKEKTFELLELMLKKLCHAVIYLKVKQARVGRKIGRFGGGEWFSYRCVHSLKSTCIFSEAELIYHYNQQTRRVWNSRDQRHHLLFTVQLQWMEDMQHFHFMDCVLYDCNKDTWN